VHLLLVLFWFYTHYLLYIYEKLYKFVYNGLNIGFTWMHMNIYEKLCKFVYNGLDSEIRFTWMHMNIYEKLCKFVYNGLDSAIGFTWMHMNIYMRNFANFYIFSDRFFDPVFSRFRFGSGFWGRLVQ
jgi:hypothetical protein